VAYTIGGEQYVAVFASGTGIPYGNSIRAGDMLWAFKLGGSYTSASGSSEMPTPGPLNMRRPVGGTAVEGSTVNNTVYLARASRTTDTAAAADGTASGAMNPTHMRVPVGTTVTFLNPGSAQFPLFPNGKPHCATQFFEGLFNLKVNPGQSATHTFTKEGEYFFNDCTDPRPTGKVVAYHVPQDLPGALDIVPRTVDVRPDDGVFTSVHGHITVMFKFPEGYTFDGNVQLKTPLSTALFQPERTQVTGNNTLIATFAKATIDNNVPAGNAVPLVVTANFMHAGVQKQLRSTATVRVVK
jgi:quinohemoprotein ethanol dehydrogenase